MLCPFYPSPSQQPPRETKCSCFYSPGNPDLGKVRDLPKVAPLEGPELQQTQNPHSSFCHVPLLWSISSSVITLFTSSGKSDQKLHWAYGMLWFFVFTFIMKIFKYIQNRDEYNETPSLHLPVPTTISLHPTLIHLYLHLHPLHSTESQTA